ncbi:hypothetical protein ERJ75_000748200 [Trypanosoma vivax]|nr:hypothetical protein ERJ75_000748200 [Trypanosoma vivax]
MEFEQLDLGKKCILNAISRQEVAEYYDILHPNVLVVTHFRYPPLPPIIANTIPTLARVHRAESKETLKHVYANNPWRMANKAAVSVKGKGDSNGIKPVHDAKEGATVSKAVSGSGANAARVHLMVDDKNRKGQPRASLSAADMPYVADIVEGPLLATARFYTILHWMNQGSHIAETNVDMEVRKVILQESDVLPPPPPPKNEAEWYARLGRQHTDRNQRLSRLIVTYGRELLMFRDECYFEDGCIVTVHRFMLTTQEMLEAQDLAEYHQQSMCSDALRP